MSAPVAPYSGPWYGPSNKQGKPRYRGPAAIAMKRTISRGWKDLIPWNSFNANYNVLLENAVKEIQKQNKLDVTGQTGRGVFSILRRRKVPAGKPNAGDWAMDPIAVRLFEDAFDIKYPPTPPVENVREALSDYLTGIEAYASRWSYTQTRPYSSLGNDPDDGGRGDCSSTVMLAYYWARDETGVHVPDPSGYSYTGYGNSQSIWERNPRASGPWKVGDCALYGPYSSRTTHVTVCRKAGNDADAIFTSHGSQAGPNATRIYYRSDLLGVVRPKLTP